MGIWLCNNILPVVFSPLGLIIPIVYADEWLGKKIQKCLGFSQHIKNQ